MADENQLLQEEMNRLRESLQNGGMTAKEFGDALRKSEKGLDAFADATAKGAKQIAAGMGSFALQVGQGDTNFKSLNKVVDVASDALAGMAKAIPFAGEAVAAGLKAAAEGAKFMLDQMDQTTKAFNDLGRVGALTASGMSGLQKQFVQSGLTLNSFSKIVGEKFHSHGTFPWHDW
jgi:methyl-accepting chemotaxis protein